MEQVEEMHTRRLALKSVKGRPREGISHKTQKTLRFFYNIFPQVPQHFAEKVLGHTRAPPGFPTSGLESEWKKLLLWWSTCTAVRTRARGRCWREKEDSQGLVVLCVDIEHGCDMHNPYVIRSGQKRRRTVSAARLRDDDGPRAVRGRSLKDRWGLLRNAIREQVQVDRDSALWLKAM